MKSIRFERLARWVAGALMLLLVHGFAAPRTAWAGCNHLVVSTSDRILDFHRLDALITGGSSASLSDDPARLPLPDPVSKRPKPCSGPGCSKSVPMPAPTAFPDRDRSDQWGNLNSLPILPIASLATQTIDDPVDRPAGHKPSIFHPPPA